MMILAVIFYVIAFSWVILTIMSLSGNRYAQNIISFIVDNKGYNEEKKYNRSYEVFKNGTPEEKIEIINKIDPNYQMMTDEEVEKKYKGLDFNKVFIMDVPSSIYNIDEKKFLNFKETHEVINGILQLKPGNRQVCVESYDNININLLNTYEKIAIFRHKTDNYRYKILDCIV